WPSTPQWSHETGQSGQICVASTAGGVGRQVGWRQDGTRAGGLLGGRFAAGMAWPPGLPRPRRPDEEGAAVRPPVNLLVLVRRRGATHAPRIRGIAGAHQECGY